MNTRNEQKYREEVGIYGVTKNTVKKYEYIEGADIPEEVRIYGRSRNIEKK